VGGEGADSGADADAGSDSGARRWVVPALLFVAGLLLGGVAVAATNLGSGDSDPIATPSVSPSPSPSPSPATTDGPQDVTVRIPSSCVQVAEEADAAFDDVDAFAEAVRSFDARQLQDFLDRFQEVRPRIESLSQQCQEAASEGLVDGDLITPTPAASS
jgi:hypothetical protein